MDDRSRVNESAEVQRTCVVCGEPIRTARNGQPICGCLVHGSSGAAPRPPMPDLDVARLRAEHRPEDVAEVVRRSLDAPNLCVDAGSHGGPFVTVSRHQSVAPHVQCAACGHVDRSGRWAAELP